jgi:hypothetical protein
MTTAQLHVNAWLPPVQERSLPTVRAPYAAQSNATGGNRASKPANPANLIHFCVGPRILAHIHNGPDKTGRAAGVSLRGAARTEVRGPSRNDLSGALGEAALKQLGGGERRDRDIEYARTSNGRHGSYVQPVKLVRSDAWYTHYRAMGPCPTIRLPAGMPGEMIW